MASSPAGAGGRAPVPRRTRTCALKTPMRPPTKRPFTNPGKCLKVLDRFRPRPPADHRHGDHAAGRDALRVGAPPAYPRAGAAARVVRRGLGGGRRPRGPVRAPRLRGGPSGAPRGLPGLRLLPVPARPGRGGRGGHLGADLEPSLGWRRASTRSPTKWTRRRWQGPPRAPRPRRPNGSPRGRPSAPASPAAVPRWRRLPPRCEGPCAGRPSGPGQGERGFGRGGRGGGVGRC